MTPGPGIEPGTHWWKASALTTTPTLLPVCQYLEIATKEILICPPADYQQEIVSLSEKKERNKQLAALPNP